MKKFNQLLASFMESKSINLKEMYTIPQEWYFLEEDREEIMSWPEKDAKKYWLIKRDEKKVIKMPVAS